MFRHISQWVSGSTRTLIIYLILICIFIACAYIAWQKIGARILASPEYLVGPQQIEITQPPPWIAHTDIRAEIFNDLNRQGTLSIMDDDLTERVATALLRQPWVAKVRQVKKQFPAKVKADVTYRQPVCMIEIPGGLMPVDVEGTLLPRDDFSPVEAARYPKLVGVDRSPMGNVGSRWGDSRVAGGAEIANKLLPYWEKFKLERIVFRTPAESATGTISQQGMAQREGAYYYDIIAHGGMRIIWGTAPGDNAPGEPGPDQKVKKLLQFFEEHGSLDYSQHPPVLDLQRL